MSNNEIFGHLRCPENESKPVERQDLIVAELQHWEDVISKVYVVAAKTFNVDARLLNSMVIGPLANSVDSKRFIGIALRQLRKRIGWTQSHLAKLIAKTTGKKSADKSCVSRLENGKEPLTCDDLFSICRVFGIRAKTVCEYADALAILEELPVEAQQEVFLPFVNQIQIRPEGE